MGVLIFSLCQILLGCSSKAEYGVEVECAWCKSERREKAYRVLLGKPEGRRPRGRPRRRWDYNVQMEMCELDLPDLG
jgi:hypothetical protein